MERGATNMYNYKEPIKYEECLTCKRLIPTECQTGDYCARCRHECKMQGEITNMTHKELLEDFAEYCHQFYNGTTLQNGEWEYSYKNEVISMIEGYLKSKKSK